MCGPGRALSMLIVTVSEQKHHPQIPKQLQIQKTVQKILKFHWAINFGFPITAFQNRFHIVLGRNHTFQYSGSILKTQTLFGKLLPYAISQLKNGQWIDPPPVTTSPALKGVPDLASSDKDNPCTPDCVTSCHPAKGPLYPSPGNSLHQLIFTWGRAF